jgi:hypothetical protein
MSARSAAKPAAAPAANKAPAAKAPAAKPATKAVATKATPAAEPAIVEAPAPAAEPAPAQPEAAPQDPAGEPAEKKRQQLTSILGVNISQARCATHLKQNLGDSGVEDQIKKLREDLKRAKEGGDAPREAELKGSIAELSKSLVRLSHDTSIAVAVVCDVAVKDLICCGMNGAIAQGRRVVEVSNYHGPDAVKMLCHPLVCKLPSYAGYNPEHEEELRKERTAANKAAKEAREAKKAAAAAADGKAPVKQAPVAKKPAEEDAEEDDDHAGSKTTFFTYVDNALKGVKKDPAYSTMRVSNRVREDLSDIVAELISRFAKLARVLVQDVANVRTMNAEHIKAVVQLLMVDEERSAAQVGEIAQQIDEKLAVYHGHVESERTKKTAELSDGERAELEAKKVEADFNRKKKQADAVKNRAVSAAQKAKLLMAEVSELEPLVKAKVEAAKPTTASA